MATFKIWKVLLGSAARKSSTRLYPVEKREYQERTRGHVVHDSDTCILCGICERKCPGGALKVDKAARTWTINRMACVQCNYCVEVCPKSSLSMDIHYIPPSVEKVIHTEKVPEKPKVEKPAADKPS